MKNGLYYLAIPYNGSENQRQYRTELSLKAAAEFLRQGIHVFAPINYSNPIVDRLDLPSLSERRDIIMPYLLKFLHVSKGLILLTADGWRDSWGVQQELKFCQEHQIPIYKMSPEQVGSDVKHIFATPWDQSE